MLKLVKNKGGRPQAVIDWPKIEQLCNIQCTGEEIASVLDLDYQTIERAIKRKYKIGFEEYYKKHCGTGRASLRRMQWLSAKNGNATMQIWLGKQTLDQKDKQDISSDNGTMSPNNHGDAILELIKAERTAIRNAQKKTDTE